MYPLFKADRALRLFAAACVIWCATAVQAMASSLIRDADIEYALGQLAQPILNAAGLNPNRVRVLVIDDPSLNAFVVDGNHIFIHSGLILKAGRAAELQAVIAHEAAHIANGHFVRRMGNRQAAQRATMLGFALAAAAAAAGNPDASAGLATGVASSAMRNFLAHTRAEEASADQSSLRYMVSAGVDPQGAVDVLEHFRGQEALAARRQDPYIRSHPLTQDRIRALRGYAAAYAGKTAPNPTADYWFLRARAKLSAFTRNSNWTLRRIAPGATDDLSLMQRAIALHRKPDAKAARNTIDRLVAARPKDPFYHELRGQILLESRDIPGAIGAYRSAAGLAPRNAQILGGYGRALLAGGDGRALDVLQKARARDAEDARILRDLATAYAKAGQNGMASVTTAERYALRGRLDDAAIHARRAVGLLPAGSTGARRAQDILAAAEAAARRR